MLLPASPAGRPPCALSAHAWARSSARVHPSPPGVQAGAEVAAVGWACWAGRALLAHAAQPCVHVDGDWPGAAGLHATEAAPNLAIHFAHGRAALAGRRSLSGANGGYLGASQHARARAPLALLTDEAWIRSTCAAEQPASLPASSHACPPATRTQCTATPTRESGVDDAALSWHSLPDCGLLRLRTARQSRPAAPAVLAHNRACRCRSRSR